MDPRIVIIAAVVILCAVILLAQAWRDADYDDERDGWVL